MFFDTHAHYNDAKFDKDRESILNSLSENKVKYVVNIGTDIPSSEYSISMAEKYPFMYASVGFHPDSAHLVNDESILKLKELCKHPKVVAIGETGLDYYWESNPPKEIQQQAFIKQIALAEELDLPVIVHNRESTMDMINILKDTMPRKCIIHCASISIESAKILLSLDCYISFAGTVTFKNASKLRNLAKTIPLNRLLIETDSPYLAPEPLRGSINDSRNLIHTAKTLSDTLGLEVEEIASITLNNAKRIYNID